MPTGVAFIRGINVGGRNLLPMADLWSLCEGLGLRDACTHLQSGNLVFRAAKRDFARAANGLEAAIETQRGFRPSVVLRTLDELRNVVQKNPLARRPGLEGNKLLVMFLASDPPSAAKKALGALKSGPDWVHLAGREVYLYFAGGVVKSTLSMAQVEKAVGVPGTCRNWNTVSALLEMAEELDAI